jgi:hypothetical protein
MSTHDLPILLYTIGVKGRCATNSCFIATDDRLEVDQQSRHSVSRVCAATLTGLFSSAVPSAEVKQGIDLELCMGKNL